MIEMTAVAVALITGICAVIGQWLIARENKRKSDAEQAVRDERTKMRLDSIEAKLDEHNGYAKRFEEVAVSLAELRTELRLKMKG